MRRHHKHEPPADLTATASTFIWSSSAWSRCLLPARDSSGFAGSYCLIKSRGSFFGLHGVGGAYTRSWFLLLSSTISRFGFDFGRISTGGEFGDGVGSQALAPGEIDTPESRLIPASEFGDGVGVGVGVRSQVLAPGETYSPGSRLIPVGEFTISIGTGEMARWRLGGRSASAGGGPVIFEAMADKSWETSVQMVNRTARLVCSKFQA